MIMHKIPTLKWLTTGLLACALLLGPRLGLARYFDCSASGAPGWPSTSQLTKLGIPRDLPVGAGIPGSKVAISLSVTCPAGVIPGGTPWRLSSLSGTTTAVSGLSNVYTVAGGPAGVGFRILDASGNALQLTTDSVQLNDGAAGQTRFTWNGAFELVKVGATPATGSQSLRWVAMMHDQQWVNGANAGNNAANAEKNSTITFSYSVTEPALTTCTVLNKDQTVNLPTVSAANVNTSSGQLTGSTPFSISLNCSAGARLYMTITDAECPNSTFIILGQCKRGNAGIMMNRAGSSSGIVWFGPDSPASGTKNQFLVGATTNGILNVDFVAYYNVTNGTIFSPGPVTGKATFTLSYQ